MSDTNTYYQTKMQGMYLWSPEGRQTLLCPPIEKIDGDVGTPHHLLRSYIGQNEDGDLAFIVRDPDGTRHIYPQSTCELMTSPIPTTTGPEYKVVRVHDHTGPALLLCEAISETIYFNGWPKIKYKTGPRY